MFNVQCKIHNELVTIKALTTVIVFLCFSDIYSQVKSDFVLTPCVGNEILNAKTSEADLSKIVGKKNVERVERWYAEGTERIIGSVSLKILRNLFL